MNSLLNGERREGGKCIKGIKDRTKGVKDESAKEIIN
jgi:hypothetical protein